MESVAFTGEVACAFPIKSTSSENGLARLSGRLHCFNRYLSQSFEFFVFENSQIFRNFQPLIVNNKLILDRFFLGATLSENIK